MDTELTDFDSRLAVSVVVPVYNSQDLLPNLAKRLCLTLGNAARAFELVLVNDGSHDRSWDVIGDLAMIHPWLRGINLVRNYGQHNALLCGVRAARYEIAVTMDDDLQHPPEEIPKLLERLGADIDVVYGMPAQEQHGLWRDVATQVTKFALQSAMGARIARKAGAF